MPDKFTATWISHSSLSDFIKCPRSYYLKNVYKDPSTNHKVQIVTPALSLGSAVHQVVEALSTIKTEDRFKEPLIKKFNTVWKKYSGKKGGFSSTEEENKYKKIGEEMIRKVMDNPGPLANLAVKIKQDLPYYWLSEEDNIILCGKIDWLEYFPDTDSVHIIDFKTSKREEDDSSLQLPIYHLLVHNTQHRKVAKASYWYLRLHDYLVEKELPDLVEAHDQILALAKKVKLARQLEVFKCPNGPDGCFACRPMEKIIRGEAEKVGVNDYGQDMYMIEKESEVNKNSEVL